MRFSTAVWQMIVQINPSMRTGFLAFLAFFRPPRLTLNVSKRSVTWSRPNVRRGGAEKGPRGVEGAHP